jgi:hypothetical protein
LSSQADQISRSSSKACILIFKDLIYWASDQAVERSTVQHTPSCSKGGKYCLIIDVNSSCQGSAGGHYFSLDPGLHRRPASIFLHDSFIHKVGLVAYSTLQPEWQKGGHSQGRRHLRVLGKEKGNAVQF